MKKIKSFDKNYFILFVISLLIMIPLINNLYFEGHDTGFHIANILAISDNLSYHNIFNLKILPMIGHNFGYGTGIFYPTLSHLIPALIYKFIPLSISVFTALKITNFLIILLSGICMYKFLKTVTKNNKISLISTIFYLTAPYKLYDMFVRDAIAESFIFVFIPLVLLGIYNLLNKNYKKFYLYFVIGYVGLFNSHLVMTIYTTVFIIFFLLFQFKKIWQKDIIKHFLIASVIIILICLPFLIPLLTHKIMGSYKVFDKNAMANPYGVYFGGLSYHYFIGWPKDIGYHFINYFALFLIIFLLIKIIKQKKLKDYLKNNYLFTIGFVFTVFGIWMSSLLFPWIIIPNILLMIQFPWRLGTFTAIGISILTFFALKEIKNQKKMILISIISCILVSLFCLGFQKYQKISEDNYDLSRLGMGWQYEYLPTKTKNNKEYFDNRSHEILIKSGESDIEILKDNVPDLEFKAENVLNATLEIPRLYYYGYEIKAIYEDFEEILDYQENENGFIEIKLEKSAIIKVTYTGTKLMQISNKISIMTICVFGIYILIKKGE